jgi:hypothetical protein
LQFHPHSLDAQAHSLCKMASMNLKSSASLLLLFALLLAPWADAARAPHSRGPGRAALPACVTAAAGLRAALVDCPGHFVTDVRVRRRQCRSSGMLGRLAVGADVFHSFRARSATDVKTPRAITSLSIFENRIST